MLTDEQRAERAKLILNEPVFNEAFDAMQNNIYTKLKSVGLLDVDEQQSLIVRLQQLDTLKKILRTHIETGKLKDMQAQKPTRKI